MKWNEESDRKLLLTILEGCDVKLDSQAVSNAMAANGETCTPRAVEDRFRKLKRMKREQDAADAGARALVAMSTADDTDLDTDVVDDEDDGAAAAPKAKAATKTKSPVKVKVNRKAGDNDDCGSM